MKITCRVFTQRFFYKTNSFCSSKHPQITSPRNIFRLSYTNPYSPSSPINFKRILSFKGSLYVLHRTTERQHVASNSSIINFCGSLPVRQFSINSSIESIAQTQAGWFKSLSESSAVSYAQDFFVSVHNVTGLPWWASIMLTTVLLRTFVTLPLAIYQNYILAKVENLTLEMPDIVKELKRETAFAIKKYNWSEKEARTIYNRSLKKQWKQLIIRDNCHPFKASLLLWVQIPMWICFSSALRNLVYMLPHSDTAAQLVCMELTVGGFGWIPNLTAVDSSLILPITFGVLNLAIIELQAMSRVKKPSKLQTIATNVFRGFSIVMVPIAANVPACLCLYWTTSCAYGLVQNLVLLSPKVKHWTGVPSSASQLAQPYQHIADKILERASWMSRLFAPK